MLQAQRKAFYSDELLDMITSREELHGLTQTNFWERLEIQNYQETPPLPWLFGQKFDTSKITGRAATEFLKGF